MENASSTLFLIPEPENIGSTATAARRSSAGMSGGLSTSSAPARDQRVAQRGRGPGAGDPRGSACRETARGLGVKPRRRGTAPAPDCESSPGCRRTASLRRGRAAPRNRTSQGRAPVGSNVAFRKADSESVCLGYHRGGVGQRGLGSLIVAHQPTFEPERGSADDGAPPRSLAHVQVQRIDEVEVAMSRSGRWQIGRRSGEGGMNHVGLPEPEICSATARSMARSRNSRTWPGSRGDGERRFASARPRSEKPIERAWIPSSGGTSAGPNPIRRTSTLRLNAFASCRTRT